MLSVEKLTWEEIKAKYPHMHVGLVEVEYADGRDGGYIEKAVVKYTSEDIPYDVLCLKAIIDKEIDLRYTTLDDDSFGGYQSGMNMGNGYVSFDDL